MKAERGKIIQKGDWVDLLLILMMGILLTEGLDSGCGLSRAKPGSGATWPATSE